MGNSRLQAESEANDERKTGDYATGMRDLAHGLLVRCGVNLINIARNVVYHRWFVPISPFPAVGPMLSKSALITLAIAIAAGEA
ncbi:hypothetical protein Q670_09340 [Alcanivorax sp. P2S70]|jgi:hypothetical protein|uniref:Uncharacterized protein n=1 Tax=Alcanivorax profundi TaxID=2338368 RepID=A0A418Y2N4_9GAMM|nr:hypothetical protein Q670_09340 [Alcanivorax sp. P2S70]RJG19804.1 hypothetical protein D4A39_02855 [Alcanivorax profundi]